MPLQVGDRLESYEILAPLGSGGMGAVWKARDTKLGRLVAIKVLKEDHGDLARLIQEARAAAQLNHPNIVTIHEIGEHEGRVFVVMEFIDGRVLNEYIGKKGLPLQEALKFVIPIMRALEVAHKAGIVHRDLKPHNVMVNGSGDVKLLDFGLAKVTRPTEIVESGEQTATLLDRPSTGKGQILGTVAYMSPEQAQGKVIDARSDIFSFGTLFYEALTGRRPFEGQDSLSVLASILRDEPKPPGTVSGVSLAPEAETIVLRCLRKDPQRRFQNASDLRTALEDLNEELSSRKLSAVEPSPHRRKMRWWIPIAAAAALLLAMGAWRIMHAPKTSAPIAPTQVTFDNGIAATAAISPDGKLLAFASDRAGSGNLDIWLRQTAGGALVRLTSHAVAEYYPQFSPDGTRLYYLTGEQSIYEIPALGGPSRKVAGNAGPFTISSKGEIVFTRPAFAARPGPIFIMASAGAPAEPWHPECRSLPHPAWSPDGGRLFFVGECGEKMQGGMTAPRQGGAPESLLSAPTNTYGWAPAPAWFRLASGAEGVIYSERGRLRRYNMGGGPAAFEVGANIQFWPAVSPQGNLIFTEGERYTAVWSLTLDTTGTVSDPTPASIVTGNGHFSVSRDGNALVYGRLTSNTAGELVIRNLASGDEKVFAEHNLLGVTLGSLWPQISPDGGRIIYRVVGKQGGHYLLRVDSGEVRRVATLEQFQLGSDWSADDQRILGECAGPRMGICQLDPESGVVKPLAVHATDQLLYPSWSWDARMMAFMRRRPGGIAAIWIAPVAADGTLAPEPQWVEISPPQTDNSRPRFSPDGGVIYYVMGKAGQRLLAAQKIDKASRKPVGEPIVTVHTPLELTLLTGGAGPYPLISVTAKRLFYSSYGYRGNLWMTRID